MDCSPPGSPVHGNSRGKNTGVGCHSPLQGYSQPRDQTQISCFAGRFFTTLVTKEPPENKNLESPQTSINKGNFWHILCLLPLTTASNMQLSPAASSLHHLLSAPGPQVPQPHRQFRSINTSAIQRTFQPLPGHETLKSLKPFNVFQNENTSSLLKVSSYQKYLKDALMIPLQKFLDDIFVKKFVFYFQLSQFSISIDSEKYIWWILERGQGWLTNPRICLEFSFLEQAGLGLFYYDEFSPKMRNRFLIGPCVSESP